MRRLKATTAALAVVLLAACGDDPPLPLPGTGPPAAVDLEVVFGAMIRSTPSTFSVRLRCDPPGGAVVDPEAACERLETEPVLLVSPPVAACDRPPTEWEVAIRGDYRGRAVDVFFSRCHPEQVARWMRVVDFDIPEPGV